MESVSTFEVPTYRTNEGSIWGTGVEPGVSSTFIPLLIERTRGRNGGKAGEHGRCPGFDPVPISRSKRRLGCKAGGPGRCSTFAFPTLITNEMSKLGGAREVPRDA